MTHRLEILYESDDFIKSFYNFLIEKSLGFKREVSINSIFNISDTTLYDFLIKISPITIDPLYGSTYCSMYRDITNINDISHNITSFEIDNNGIYGNVELVNKNDIYESIDILSLKPIYTLVELPGKILTFDIYYNKL